MRVAVPGADRRGGSAGGVRARRDLTWRNARGFSILELLVSLSLLALVAALVIPMSIGAIARAGAEEARPRLEAAVAEARLEASRAGAPVRLVCAADGGVVRIEMLRLRGADRGDEEESLLLDPAPARGSGRFVAFAESAEAGEGEWTLLNEIALPEGVVLAVAASETMSAETAALSVFTMSGRAEEAGAPAQEPAEPWTVATALPDGRLESSGERIVLRAGRRGDAPAREWSVRFAAWTGSVTLTPRRRDVEEGGVDDDPGLPPSEAPAAAVEPAGGAAEGVRR